MPEADYGAPILEKIGEEEVSFPRLLMRDYQQLEEIVRANARDALRKMLDECSIQGEQRFDRLSKMDMIDVPMEAVESYLSTSAGARRAIAMSLARAGKTKERIEEIFNGKDVLDATNLALSLVGFRRRVKWDDVVPKGGGFPLSDGGAVPPEPNTATPDSNTPSSENTTT